MNNLMAMEWLVPTIIGVVVLLLVIILVSWYINTRNNFVRIKNKVEEAWASIDVYLKKRFDFGLRFMF